MNSWVVTESCKITRDDTVHTLYILKTKLWTENSHNLKKN